ncbi:MAG: phytanoyl-CoA dioxygenase family protein [Gammaproteobacteria bacterium]|nr:phytanoyl-CoA dioxygenase family protein [Gammaproteobacteria bacterium]
MNTVFYDATVSDDERRQALYDGQLFAYSPRKSSLDFIEFARQQIRDAFAPLDPETAQYELPVEKFAEVLGRLKPGFIHHPDSKRHLQNVLRDLGCDLGKTYFDVPKMRSSTSDKYLTTGIAYAWHPHRDTWYAAPHCQINWWIPIFDIRSDNAMAFHPQYWNRPVRNSSSDFNYYRWNKESRGAHIAQFVKEDPRPLPRATEPMTLEPQVRLIVPAGGIILFSGAQMHSSVPNTSGKTRFSVDFRVVNSDDAANMRGAPKVDDECTGTTMRDYLRGTDLSRLPDELVALYDDNTAADGALIYENKA